MSSSSTENTNAGDVLVQGLTMDAKVRFLLAEFKDSLNQAIQKHGLNQGSTRYLSQALGASLLLSSQIKGDERLSVQLESSEPACRIICDVNADGGVRAKITPAKMQSDVESATLDGFLVTIKHNQSQELYRGTTEIRQETIGSALEHHLNQSSQLNCMVRIETRFDTNGLATHATALLLEKYPESADNPSATPEEFALAYKDLHTLSKTDFLAGCSEKEICTFGLFALESKEISWFCGCSEERITTMLSSIGPEELNAMIEELGEIEVICEFCSTRYVRDQEAIRQLVEEISYI